MDLIEKFFLSFIPLFVAMDAVGVLPVFWHLTSDLEPERKKKLITQATLTAMVCSVVFLFTGKALFVFLGINENDFRVAGGLLLLIISIMDLTVGRSHRKDDTNQHIGVVPIGIPLIIGPAALTTILLHVDSYGPVITLLSLLVNLGFVWILFQKSHFVLKLVGEAGARAAGKIMALFLAAIAVMMIRVGLDHFIHG